MHYLQSISSSTSNNSAELIKQTDETDKSMDRLMAPLKTPRAETEASNSKADKQNDQKNISRLLNSALSSARNDSNPKKNKRNIQELAIEESPAGRRNNNKNVKSSEELSSMRTKHQRVESNGQYQQPSVAFQPPLPPGPMPPPAVPMNYGMMPADPVQYFEHMNEVAIKSGFKNAQEMLAAFPGNAPSPFAPPPPAYGMEYPPYGVDPGYPPYNYPAYPAPPRHFSGRSVLLLFLLLSYLLFSFL